MSMQVGRREAEEEDADDTPPTRPYADALLHGDLSLEQIADLRAEIASRAADETARLARSYSLPPPQSFGGGSHPASGPVPIAAPRPPDVDEDRERRSGPGEEYEEILDDIYLAALGGTDSIPSLAVPVARIAELPIEPQAAFVLSRIDGGSSVEDVIDMSAALTRVETLRILYGLLEQGIIRFAG
jgi:hypothetical protein